jgi:protein gp37
MRRFSLCADYFLPVLPNVWLGTSVGSADYLGRIDDLRKVDAAVRFVSFEPLLGSVARADLTGIHWAHRRRREQPALAPPAPFTSRFASK